MNTSLQDRIHAFSLLGHFLKSFVAEDKDTQATTQQAALQTLAQQLNDYMQLAGKTQNAWFTPEYIKAALAEWGQQLQAELLSRFMQAYPLKEEGSAKTVGLVTAGNLPLVGFHDYMCVLLSGHKAMIKLSSDDNVLLPLLHKILSQLSPAMAPAATFTQDTLKGIEAVIATGSNNSARYFDYYFGKYPHIIRHNRHSVAVLDGSETESELQALAHDILQYFGRGCRSVSQLYLPQGYPLNNILDAMQHYHWLQRHSKYMNNYEYNKAIYLVNKIAHLDNGFVLLTENDSLSSPIAVLHYSYYHTAKDLEQTLKQQAPQLQCTVGHNFIPFGQAQQPALHDFADGVDTLKFLVSL